MLYNVQVHPLEQCTFTCRNPRSFFDIQYCKPCLRLQNVHTCTLLPFGTLILPLPDSAPTWSRPDVSESSNLTLDISVYNYATGRAHQASSYERPYPTPSWSTKTKGFHQAASAQRKLHSNRHMKGMQSYIFTPGVHLALSQTLTTPYCKPTGTYYMYARKLNAPPSTLLPLGTPSPPEPPPPCFFFFFHTHLLSTFWTSLGHMGRPFFPPVLAFNFYRA